MTEQEDRFQAGFEAGLRLGLMASLAAIDQGEGRPGVAAMVKQMDDVKRRRALDAIGCRQMIERDIYLERPLMQISDLYSPAHQPKGPEA